MKRVLALCACLVFAYPVVAMTTATAHGLDDFYELDAYGYATKLWRAERGSVNIYVDYRVTGEYRSRIYDGAKRWDVEGQTLNFSAQGTGAYGNNPCGAPRNRNMVFRAYIDGDDGKGDGDTKDTLGDNLNCYYHNGCYGPFIENGVETYRCDTGIHAFKMRFDRDDELYTGTGEIPGGQGWEADVWSVATHEFGHAGGWGTGKFDHFSESNTYCQWTSSNEYRQTMCNTPKGKTWARTLGTHDQDVFNKAY